MPKYIYKKNIKKLDKEQKDLTKKLNKFIEKNQKEVTEGKADKEINKMFVKIRNKAKAKQFYKDKLMKAEKKGLI